MDVTCIFCEEGVYKHSSTHLDNFRVNFSLLYQSLYLIINGVRLYFCLMVNEYADLPIHKTFEVIVVYCNIIILLSSIQN